MLGVERPRTALSFGSVGEQRLRLAVITEHVLRELPGIPRHAVEDFDFCCLDVADRLLQGTRANNGSVVSTRTGNCSFPSV